MSAWFRVAQHLCQSPSTDSIVRHHENAQPQHLAHLHKYGYVIIRGALDKKIVKQLRNQVDSALQSSQQSPEYLLHRILHSVNSPRNRHEVNAWAILALLTLVHGAAAA